MIKDRVENAMAYAPLGAGISRAMSYLQQTDFSRTSPGKYEIDDQRVFAMVQQYRLKPPAQAAWESHHRYIDVQFMVRGLERIGHLSLRDGPKVIKPYDPHTDLVFYEPRGDLLLFHPGEFAIFTPQDVHAPGLALDSTTEPGEVLKVIIKVRVQENHECGF